MLKIVHRCRSIEIDEMSITLKYVRKFIRQSRTVKNI